jgi:hypothetical protein
MGDLVLKAAINSGAIELDGTRDLRQRLERWLGLSGFAGIKDMRGPMGAATASNRVRSEDTGLRRPI